jgi:CRISPR/Cas system-associated protein Cas7 (RAMP superfamily)
MDSIPETSIYSLQKKGNTMKTKAQLTKIANKAVKTRRENEKKEKRRQAALKAWKTRRLAD